MAAFEPSRPLLRPRSRATRPANDILLRSPGDGGGISVISLKYDSKGEKDTELSVNGGKISTARDNSGQLSPTPTSPIFPLPQSTITSNIMDQTSSFVAESSTVTSPSLSADPLTTTYKTRASFTVSYYSAVETTTPGRRGVHAHDHDHDLETTLSPIFQPLPTVTSAFVIALPDSSTIASPNALPDSDLENESSAVSPSGVQALVALGTIGAIFLFGFIVYFAFRLIKIDVLQILNRRRQRKESSWAYKMDPRRDTFSRTLGMYNEKSIPTQRHLDAFYSPIVIPQKIATPPANSLARAGFEGQELVRDSLTYAPPPISKTETVEESSAKTFFLSQTPVQQQSPPLPESNRISELSSLSSGFGDAKIDVPESGPTNFKLKSIQRAITTENNNGQCQEFVSRFSWTTTNTDARQLPTQGKRDTVATIMSMESAPRFRSVTSWVNQQSSRIHRQQDSEKELKSLPKIPVNLAELRNSSQQGISNEVTDPIFNQHPGNAVEMEPGPRVASFILNKKLGI